MATPVTVTVALSTPTPVPNGVELFKSTPACVLMETLLSNSTELNAIDSTALPLLKFLRKGKIMTNKATVWYKAEKLWFYGFKAHVLINSQGELVEIEITPANVHDLTPVKQGMLRFCTGVITADSAYISNEVSKNMGKQGCVWLARPKENQEKQFTPDEATVYKFRVSIERLFSVLKRNYNLVDFNPRHYKNFLVNTYAAFVAFMLKQKSIA